MWFWEHLSCRCNFSSLDSKQQRSNIYYLYLQLIAFDFIRKNTSGNKSTESTADTWPRVTWSQFGVCFKLRMNNFRPLAWLLKVTIQCKVKWEKAATRKDPVGLRTLSAESVVFERYQIWSQIWYLHKPRWATHTDLSQIRCMIF